MEKILPYKMSRGSWGVILVIAALFALAAAWLLEKLGLSAPGIRPLHFVGAVVGAKLGLFAVWPQLATKGRAVLTTLRRPRPSSLALWDEHDPRLDLSLFSTNVPTFVLNQEQRLIDWNAGFDLVFGDAPGIKRGAHVTNWYALLDNFRRVPKRADKLYGEGILPITDRERATYLSPEFGRMVFTKIMSPVVDRGSGRIIGWTVVLNVNSVNKRLEFFEQLYARIAAETKKIRYAAAYDGLVGPYAPRRALVQEHLAALGPLGAPGRVLEVGCGTGSLTLALAAAGHRVTAVDGDTHLLRRAKDRLLAAGLAGHVKLVRREPARLGDLPAARYDAVHAFCGFERLVDPAALLAQLHAALKSGGLLTLSVRVAGADGPADAAAGVASLYNDVRRALETQGRFDHLKHQFNHVVEHEAALAAGLALPSAASLLALVRAAGFRILAKRAGLEDGHTLLIVARR